MMGRTLVRVTVRVMMQVTAHLTVLDPPESVSDEGLSQEGALVRGHLVKMDRVSAGCLWSGITFRGNLLVTCPRL